MTTIRELANEGRPRDEADYGTDRQIDTLNALWRELETRWPEEFGELSDFSAYCLKATNDEQVDEALRLLGDRADLEVLEADLPRP